MLIIGAGMSGMLAGHYFRHLKPEIVESQPCLPNNHKALLRFRSDVVSTLTGIPFKKVFVQKMINYKGEHYQESNIFLNNMYSHKVTGQFRSRSTINLNSEHRYIAPENFIDLMSNGLDIRYSQKAELGFIGYNSGPIISTMPVYSLAKALGYELEEVLQSTSIETITFNIDHPYCDLYQTVYYPNPSLSMYRMSITGNKVIAEFVPTSSGETELHLDELIHFLEIDFGMHPSTIKVKNVKESTQKYGKLIPCDTNCVKEFIHWASVNHNIYSLGRWGTHRQILMDDVVNDIKVIDKLIRTKGYSR